MNIHDIGLGHGILDKTPKAETAIEKNKLDFIKKKFLF